LRSAPGFSAVVFRIDDPDSPCVIQRAVALAPGSHVAIVDHIRPRHGGSDISVDWRIHTKADVTCQGAHATLELLGVELKLSLIARFPAGFEKEAVPTPPGEADNSGFTRLLTRFTVPPVGIRMAAIFQLEMLSVDSLAPQLDTLHEWLRAMSKDDTPGEAPT
jgi:hypothetical protein